MEDDDKLDDFLEQKHWGLDPLFSCYPTLFICDVLQMKKYPKAGNTYAYKNHPIHHVDIFGMVVKLDEKERYYRCDVDDGTGIIPCCCWKQPMSQPMDCGESKDMGRLCTALANLINKSKELSKVQLGDMIHLRGEIGEHWERREISASYYRVVNDVNAESAHIRSTVERYKSVYDQPFQFSTADSQAKAALQDERMTGYKNEVSVIETLKEVIVQHIEDNRLDWFTIDRLLDVPEIDDAAKVLCRECHKRQNQTTSDTIISERHHIQLAIHQLIEQGISYHYIDPGGETKYLVVEYSKLLDEAVIDILRKEKYHEGTHYLKIYEKLRQSRRFTDITAHVVKKCLDKLERDSVAVSVTYAKFVLV